MNNFKEKFKSVINNVSQEVNSQKSILEKKNQIRKHEKDLADRFKLMGEKLYSYYKNGEEVNENYMGECREVAGIYEAMRTLQSEIDSITKVKEVKEVKENVDTNDEKSSTIYCEECGNKVGKDTKFCSNCGSKIK